MRPHMDVVISVFVEQNFAISRHENRNRIREQQDSGGEDTHGAIDTPETYPRILEVRGVHKVMQGDISVEAGQADQRRRNQTCKCNERVTSEGAVKQVEPNHVRLQLVQPAQESNGTCRIIERPTSFYRKPIELLKRGRYFIRQDGKAHERIGLKLARKMKTVFTQTSLARRKSRY